MNNGITIAMNLPRLANRSSDAANGSANPSGHASFLNVLNSIPAGNAKSETSPAPDLESALVAALTALKAAQNGSNAQIPASGAEDHASSAIDSNTTSDLSGTSVPPDLESTLTEARTALQAVLRESMGQMQVPGATANDVPKDGKSATETKPSDSKTSRTTKGKANVERTMPVPALLPLISLPTKIEPTSINPTDLASSIPTSGQGLPAMGQDERGKYGELEPAQAGLMTGKGVSIDRQPESSIPSTDNSVYDVTSRITNTSVFSEFQEGQSNLKPKTQQVAGKDTIETGVAKVTDGMPVVRSIGNTGSNKNAGDPEISIKTLATNDKTVSVAVGQNDASALGAGSKRQNLPIAGSGSVLGHAETSVADSAFNQMAPNVAPQTSVDGNSAVAGSSANALVRAISEAIPKPLQATSIEIRPEGFGSIHIRITPTTINETTTYRIDIRTSDPSAHALLTDNLKDLRQNLSTEFVAVRKMAPVPAAPRSDSGSAFQENSGRNGSRQPAYSSQNQRRNSSQDGQFELPGEEG